jgi:hypothetical protein
MSRLLAATLIAALVSPGCSDLFRTKTEPTTVSVQMLGGTWASVSSATTTTDACTTFRWTVTSIGENTAAGTFSATCLGTLQVTGQASGVLTGQTLAWTVTATASGPGVTSCAIALSGSATFEGNQIRVPYSGTTCLGPVSGTEILRKP